MTATRPDIRMKDLESLLRRVEARADADGWHPTGRPCLMIVYDRSNRDFNHHSGRLMGAAGPVVHNNRYAAQPLLGDMFFGTAYRNADLQPPEALRQWAFNLCYADTDLIRQDAGDHVADTAEAFKMMLAEPVVIGFAFRCEAFHVITTAREDDTHKYDHLGEHPKATESRFVMMVDVQDRVHQVLRPRGKPTIADMNNADYYGGIPGTLRMLTDLTMDRIPMTQAGYDWRYRGIPPVEGFTDTGPITKVEDD